MQIFTLKDHDFIELNRLLKRMNLVNSGGEAKILIQDGEVRVNGLVETRVRKKLRAGVRVDFRGQTVLVE